MIGKSILSVVVILAAMFFKNDVKAQENWEPQKRITGYISTEFNYFDQLEGYKNNYGVALSEAGILTNYKPTKDLTFTAVFVYRPDFSFNQMLNEANVQYDVSESFGLKVGRFLTPLSPMNTYYYAPVNNSATLPVLISNHEFFPLNMDAISINGGFGENIKVTYDFFAGGYRNTTWMKTGAIGFFGDEVVYYQNIIGSPSTIDESFNSSYNVAVGGNVRFALQDYAKVGFSVFAPKEETFPVYYHHLGMPVDLTMNKVAYGLDFNFKYNNTRLIGEVWNSDLKIQDATVDLHGAFVELSHEVGKFTPFARYEDQTTNDIHFHRYTGGVVFKPTFETNVKLEYLHYEHDVQNVDGLVASFIYSF